MTLPAALARASHEVAELAGLPSEGWGAVDHAVLVAAVHEVARMHAQLDAVLLETTARLEACGAAQDAGWAGTKELLSHALGGHRGSGTGIVRAVEQLAELPQVREALAGGRVSLTQARVIGAEVAVLPRDEALRQGAAQRLLALAVDESVDATGLRLAMPEILRDLDPDRAARDAERERERAERNAHAQRHLALVPDQLGGVRVRGYGTVEDAELIKTVLAPLSAPVTTEPGACGGHAPERGRPTPCPDPRCHHDGRDPRDHGARLWDALVEACSRLQAADELPRQHGTVARVSVTISDEALRERVSGLLPDGERLSASAVRRLACDAEVLPAVLGTDGQVLDVGRTRRLVTPAIWLALVLRDQHCTFPGCTRLPIACDAHHLVHWSDGGPTCLDNLALLCRRHHVLAHHSPWTVRLDPVVRRPVWTPPPRASGAPTHTYVGATGPPPARLAS